jgi:ribosome-binding protein aMBF1 (putative translation factor)
MLPLVAFPASSGYLKENKMNKINKNNFGPAKQHAVLTSGEVIKMLRELKEWTQEELAKRCKINASNISLLENNKVEIGKRRTEQLAHAFNIHPAIIMFPEYESEEIKKAA